MAKISPEKSQPMVQANETNRLTLTDVIARKVREANPLMSEEEAKLSAKEAIFKSTVRPIVITTMGGRKKTYKRKKSSRVFVTLDGKENQIALKSDAPVRPGRSFRRMQDWNDLLPTEGLRKQTKKMLADQQAHVEDLVKQGRWKAARWQVGCTWVTWAWYVLKRPITSLSKSLQGKIGS
jgi:hypothetical protein